jgi:hypothetical protein
MTTLYFSLHTVVYLSGQMDLYLTSDRSDGNYLQRIAKKEHITPLQEWRPGFFHRA